MAFERVCLEHILQIKRALGIAGVYCEVNAWQCARDTEKGVYGSQIDLLIVRRDKVINLCEVKYADAEYIVDSTFDRAMKRKISDFKRVTAAKHAIHPVLITVYGVNESSYAGELQNVITGDELF